MRLIDADALKKEFPHDGDWDYPVNTNSFVVETINNAPTIDAVPRWIPCKERLPEVGEEVLCQCRANIIEVLCLEKSGFWENQSSFRNYLNSFVIAWMPLPEPYKGEKEDDE